MKPVITTLSNGLQVVVVDTKSFPTASAILLVGAGSRYENTKNNGIAHFFEHMAFKGSKKYKTSYDISATIEGLGGYFNAFTSKDHTGYWVKATSAHLETMVDVLADMVQNPLLVPDEIEREKGVIIEEMNMYEDTPARKVGDLFEQLLYKGNPLGYEVIGSKKTVNSANRETFTNYMDTLYHPDNAVMVVAGGLSTAKQTVEWVQNLVEQKFGTWEKKTDSYSYEPMVEKQDKPAQLIKYKKTEQAHFCLGYRSIKATDEKRYVQSVLATILGGGMSSRLFMQVRERRGLCYYISTGRETYADVGNFVTQAGVPVDAEKIKQAVSVILDEHETMTKGKIADDELARAKEIIKGHVLLSLEDSQRVGMWYGSDLLLNKEVRSPQDVIQKIEKVTKDQVVELAKTIVRPGNLNFTLVGPFEDIELDLH